MKFEELLSLVKRPGRYIGGEVNAWQKPWNEAETKVCCIFPDLYEIGMSHQGLLILYDLINRSKDLLADRCYCPDIDLERLLKQENMPLLSLEAQRPLKSFDLLAITLPYELCYANILTILSLSNIPFLSKDRMNENYPLILGGGSCCLNPEPVAEIFDAIVIGDGEEVIFEIIQRLQEAKDSRASKKELLKELSRIEGIYIPQFFRPIYDKNASFLGMEPLISGYERVKRRILASFAPEYEIKSPLLPNIQIVHDRLGVEISRGCTRGCRYCQASSIYRPVREKSIEHILKIAEEGIKKTGWEELSLLSLSTGDYSGIFQLIPAIMDKFERKHCSISLPSLRVGTLTPQIMDQIARVRKTGLTLAPEAGSQRLRKVINKDITEDALLDTVKSAYERGWKNVKLYFMIGLPTETDEDIEAIVKLVKKVRNQKKGLKLKGHIQITASIGTFVPKPQTPFQWERQISISESKKRIELIKNGLKARYFQVKWHDPKQSFLEGVFSRGDRRLLNLIFKAWEKGARLDAWSDNFKIDIYLKSAKELAISLDNYLKELDENAPLFWDHIDSGIKKAFLRLERKRAYKHKYTPDCRFSECQGCGVCDFKDIKPVIKKETSVYLLKEKTIKTEKNNNYFYKIKYGKLYKSRFIGHLDMVRTFHRAIRRASLPVAYSKGFHPMPKVSFGNPIPLGLESIREEAIITLNEKLPESQVMEQLNNNLPLGLTILNASFFDKKPAILPKSIQKYLVVVCIKKEAFKLDLKNLSLAKGISIREFKIDDNDIDDIIKKWLKRVYDEISCGEKLPLEISYIPNKEETLKPFDLVRYVLDGWIPEQCVKMARILKI